MDPVTYSDEGSGGSAADTEDVVFLREIIDLTNSDDDEEDNVSRDAVRWQQYVDLHEACRRSLWAYKEESCDLAVKTEACDGEQTEQDEETKESGMRVEIDEDDALESPDEKKEVAECEDDPRDDEHQQESVSHFDEVHDVASNHGNGEATSDRALAPSAPLLRQLRCICCLGELSGESARRVAPCGHVYCLPCIDARAMLSEGPTRCCYQELPAELLQEAQRFVRRALQSPVLSERKRKREGDNGDLYM